MTQGHDAAHSDLFGSIPATADQLLAMQQANRFREDECFTTAKVLQVLDFINRLDTSAFEDQQIAWAIVRQLEILHAEVAAEMQADHAASHAQIVGWAVDADRLHLCRILLESIDLH
jgi:hypothetical protein